MIDIDTHKIIDLIESREIKDVEEWLTTYPNIEIISRDGGIMYKTAGEKSHSQAKQVSDRFHILKNLTEYAKNYIKRILGKNITIKEKKDKKDKIKEYRTKWDLIEEVKKLKEKNLRNVEIAERLGMSRNLVKKYIEVPMSDKEKYMKKELEETKSKIKQRKKWELIQEIQREYEKVKNYNLLGKRYNIDQRTIKKYVNTKEEPINGKIKGDGANLESSQKEKIIHMLNDGYSIKIIKEKIIEEGYNGSERRLGNFIKYVKKENLDEIEIKHIVDRSKLISLLYKEIDKVKNITKETIDEIIKIYPEVGKIYDLIKSFKEIMFSKHDEKLEQWITDTKELNIEEINSFINGIESDIEAVKNGIKYDYNNGLAEGSVNKIKVIKRTMYGRCSFELLKQKVLLQS